MRLLGISKAGLLAIALTVCALWACIAMEKVTLLQANADARQTLDRIDRLRRPALAEPAEAPPPMRGGSVRRPGTVVS